MTATPLTNKNKYPKQNSDIRILEYSTTSRVRLFGSLMTVWNLLPTIIFSAATSVTSALEVSFNEMRYRNLGFTYLLL